MASPFFLLWFQPWLHTEITWAILKYTNTSILIVLVWKQFSKTGNWYLLKLPGDSNAQPKLSTTGRQRCGMKTKEKATAPGPHCLPFTMTSN